MSTGDVISHTFTIKNDIRRFPKDIDSVHNILARRADGKSDVERHEGDEPTDGGGRGKEGRNGG